MAHEAEIVSALAMGSKAHWGYTRVTVDVQPAELEHISVSPDPSMNRK
jgi:hypothetical protein